MATGKGNESRRSRSWSFVVWNGLLIPSVMRPARGARIPRAALPLLSLPLPPRSRRRSFPLVLKYLGFMNAAAGCINYATLFRATETQRAAASRNIMSRRLFPLAENTADKARKLRQDGPGKRTCPMSSHVASNIPWIRFSVHRVMRLCVPRRNAYASRLEVNRSIPDVIIGNPL